MAHPSAAEGQKLLEAYARFVHANTSTGPSLKVRTKLSTKFNTTIDRLRDKYPQYDWISQDFMGNLDRAARKWWNGRAMKGSGVDW